MEPSHTSHITPPHTHIHTQQFWSPAGLYPRNYYHFLNAEDNEWAWPFLECGSGSLADRFPPDGINAGGSGGELLSPGSIHPFLSNGCAHQLWLPTSVIFLCYKLDSTACGQGAITSPLKRNFFSQGLNFLKSWGNCSLRKWDGLSWSVPDGGGGG